MIAGKRGRSLLLRIQNAVLLTAVFGSLALAHDIPNERVDRAIQVILGPGRLLVDYEVSLAELTLLRDLKRLDVHATSAERDAIFRQYGNLVAPLNARGFLASIDGLELKLAPAGFDLAIEEHPRFTFHFTAELPNQGRLRLQDLNFVSSEGTSRLALKVEPPVRALEYEGPSRVESIEARPVWMLSDEEERATKQLSVSYRTDIDSMSLNASSRTADSDRTNAIIYDAPSPEDLSLRSLLQTGKPGSLIALCVLAFALGAAHSLQPGHGKTLIAATSLGAKLPWRGAALLALATALAHLSSVLLVALLLWNLPAARTAGIHTALTAVVGFLIGVLGSWRIGMALAGQGEPTAPSSDPAIQAPQPLSVGGILALGFMGGVLPCWDAVALVVVARLVGRLSEAITLLAAFSLGMAAVLVSVGVLAGRVRGMFDTRHSRIDWPRMLGLASGSVMLMLGAVLVFLTH